MNCRNGCAELRWARILPRGSYTVRRCVYREQIRAIHRWNQEIMTFSDQMDKIEASQTVGSGVLWTRWIDPVVKGKWRE